MWLRSVEATLQCIECQIKWWLFDDRVEQWVKNKEFEEEEDVEGTRKTKQISCSF